MIHMREDKTKTSELFIGQIVKSKAGRDKGEVFLVYEILDPAHVLIVNGSSRPIETPKKKKIKHLQKYNLVINGFSELKQDVNFNNALIRKLIEIEVNRR